MDFQGLVNAYNMAAAVLSVEKTADGKCGEIRIVRANEKYKKCNAPRYYDNMIYSELAPKEPRFEYYCFLCAVQKKYLHSYAENKSISNWINCSLVPISSEYDHDNIYYALFLLEMTKEPDPFQISHNVSFENASFIIQTCINLRGSSNFQETMDTVIGDILKKCEAFCSAIIMIDKKNKRFAPLCVKFNTEDVSIDDFAAYLTPEVVLSWEDTLKIYETVIVKDESDMANLKKINPLWVESLRGGGVKSLVLAPISRGKEFLGALFITNFNINRITEIEEFISLTAFFLSCEIANNQLMEQLEYLSNVDSLTGVKNRNSMNTRVDWHVQKERTVEAPYGIVFADLNSLKACNDKDGHIAGDKLLKNAAELLKKHFGDYEIYRSGGDEFVVIAPRCDKTTFEEKVASLRAESGYNAEVSLAIGSSWSEVEEDLRKNMHIADEAMYADKRDFYNEHPDKARK